MSHLERFTSILELIVKVAVFLTVSPQSSKGATQDDYLRLYNNLTANYSIHMRPVEDQSGPVLIDFYFTLFSILEVKDTESQLDLIPLMRSKWHDHNLRWNPQDFGGIEKISLTDATIWAPKLVLHPSRGDDGYLFGQDTSHFVTSNGTVDFSNTGYVGLFCELDMTYFPYDYQRCYMNIKVIDASVFEVDFKEHDAGISGEFYQNKEWLVTKLKSSVVYFKIPDKISILTITINLRRRPIFCSMNIFVPAVIVSILCLLTFFVPVESGERLSYTLTTLLSLAVYITYIGGLIPRASNPLPILFEYTVFLFIVSAVSVVLTLLVIKLRWTPVEISSDNQKYIRVFRCQIYLSKRGCLNKVNVMKWFRRVTNDENNRKASMNGVSNNNITSKTEMIANCTAIDHNFVNDMNKKVIDAEKEMKAPTGSRAMQLPSSVTEEEKSAREGNNDIDPTLLKLCNFLDLSSFCLTFLIFGIMTTRILMRFFLQEEPK